MTYDPELASLLMRARSRKRRSEELEKTDHPAASRSAEEAYRLYWEVFKYTELGTPENDEAYEGYREIQARFGWSPLPSKITSHRGTEIYQRRDGTVVRRRLPHNAWGPVVKDHRRKR